MNFIKKLIVYFCLVLPGVACASTSVNVKLNVVDDNRQPVAEAKVGMGFLLSKGGNSFDGLTDSDGYVEVTENALFGVKIFVNKDGYYESKTRTGYGDQKLTLLLREKRNPIAMYAKTDVLNASIKQGRKSGGQFGYDLMYGDFVAPHGGGFVSDLLITHSYQKKDTRNYSFNILIEFSNPDDGLIPFFFDEKFKSSKFRSVYAAPLEGYLDEWSLHKSRNGSGNPTTGNMDKNRNYYFRVRTKLNEQGEIESAHYGKIYGEFPSITYYLNPTPNDRNLEFDPKQNLLKNLKPGEQVRQP